ncbi:MAG: multicopper oxidase domain-containing protein [Gammaproteobacteria bacterium]|nr:multicopper oxidase domain-containing protein [Gammaproteobacteria bacterium]
MDRRRFLKTTGLSALAVGLPELGRTAETATDHVDPAPASAEAADYTLRIGTGLIELAPDRIVSTTTYNGRFPGPLLRFEEGRQVTVDIHNDTDTPELLHWHGQLVPDDVDGAAEERTPSIPPHGMRRIALVPGPAGFRFYHTHVRAGADLSRGLYSGQAGPVYIEPKNEPGAYDREVFLVLKEFAPLFSNVEKPYDFLAPTGIDPALRAQAQHELQSALMHGAKPGYEVGYALFSINGRMLGEGEPIRVGRGERVLFHVLNASATENRSLALPGHSFKVVALDGNPVPRPAAVPVLWLGAAERISAIVEMDQPGIWVLGDVNDEDRRRGMGAVVEYAGAPNQRRGEPVWRKPAPFRWDYRRFAEPGATAVPPDEVIDMTFAELTGADHGFNRWTINGVAYDDATMPVTWRLKLGRRYRLRMKNASDDIHPIHLHRHRFELTDIAGLPTAGVIKDVAMIGSYQTMSIDFTADQPGLSLFHCHMQSHMDYGFMGLFQTA